MTGSSVRGRTGSEGEQTVGPAPNEAARWEAAQELGLEKRRPTTERPAALLDPLIHAPARLAIVTTLMAVESADFLYLQREVDLTKGNLSAHLSKLEAAGYIAIEKRFVGKKTRTVVRITDAGRTAFRTYRERIVQLVRSAPE